MQPAGDRPQRELRAPLENYFEALLGAYGPQHWWPARTRLEVILGAILTQNTNWDNAARALRRLKEAGLLRWSRLRESSPAQLEPSVRPAGFFRQKARAIQTFVDWLGRNYRGSLTALFNSPPADVRGELLALKGIGPETADAILLYAGRQPFFVADAYTRRVLARHGLISPRAGYAAAQEFLHRHLHRDQALFNEFHALLVKVGKRHCHRDAPRCNRCPLESFLPPKATGHRTQPAAAGVEAGARPEIGAS